MQTALQELRAAAATPTPASAGPGVAGPGWVEGLGGSCWFLSLEESFGRFWRFVVFWTL